MDPLPCLDTSLITFASSYPSAFESSPSVLVCFCVTSRLHGASALLPVGLPSLVVPPIRLTCAFLISLSQSQTSLLVAPRPRPRPAGPLASLTSALLVGRMPLAARSIASTPSFQLLRHPLALTSAAAGPARSPSSLAPTCSSDWPRG